MGWGPWCSLDWWRSKENNKWGSRDWEDRWKEGSLLYILIVNLLLSFVDIYQALAYRNLPQNKLIIDLSYRPPVTSTFAPIISRLMHAAEWSFLWNHYSYLILIRLTVNIITVSYRLLVKHLLTRNEISHNLYLQTSRLKSFFNRRCDCK